MLNREECDNALTRLLRPYFAKVDVQNVYHDINRGHSIDEDSNLLTLLIMEHFSNPPLKFEEITEDEFPYWDKIEQSWCLISGEGDEVCICSIFGTDIPKYITKYNFISKYEDRFYRKQVEE